MLGGEGANKNLVARGKGIFLFRKPPYAATAPGVLKETYDEKEHFEKKT